MKNQVDDLLEKLKNGSLLAFMVIAWLSLESEFYSYYMY